MHKLRSVVAVGFTALFTAACADSPMSPSGISRDAVARESVMQATTPVLFTGGALPAALAGKFTVQNVGSGNLVCVGGGIKVTPGDELPETQAVANGAVTVTFHADNSVSFESALPISYLAVKGGNRTNAYDFDGASAGAGAYAPINSSTKPATVSHVDFCFGSPALNIAMHGAGEYDTEFAWTIEKTLGTAIAQLDGLGVQQGWNVSVSKDAGTHKNFVLGASVVISNPTPWSVTVNGMDMDADSHALVGTCALPLTIAGNSSVTCATAATSLSGMATALEALVNLDNAAFTPSGAYGSIAFDDHTANGTAAWTQHLIRDEVTINDTMKGVLGATSSSHTFSYTTSSTWACGAGEIVKTNVATIVETGASATASATYTAPACVVNLTDETAFAYDASNVRTFSSLSGGSISRWGWSIAFGGPATRTYDVYAAAGGNNIANGRKVGEVTITYSGSSVTASYAMDAGYTVQSSHLYAGSNALPTACTTSGKKTSCSTSVAPGQFTVSANGGAISVIAHAVVRGNFAN